MHSLSIAANNKKGCFNLDDDYRFKQAQAIQGDARQAVISIQVFAAFLNFLQTRKSF